MTTKITRTAPGYYEMTKNARTVTIVKVEELNGWIAAAEWDRNNCSDPMNTYKQAKRVAEMMLDLD